MKSLPHRHSVSARAADEGDILLDSHQLPALRSGPPEEYGGSGDLWSPETLLVAAVADCFVLTFRTIARVSKLDWTSLHSSTEGTLDRADGTTRFTRIDTRAELEVPAGTDLAMARRLLEQAGAASLIANSLHAEVHVDAVVRPAAAQAEATA
ncbi:MAG: OsmC family peroxiredoxin [Acidobacteria bacterium]|nr:MAG: OsmC family peroxiredoxin [Acidobacteriota bacterium]REK06132.1 MAG: OsmC family peroxiredoxin [Acidobacteriota bacterium]